MLTPFWGLIFQHVSSRGYVHHGWLNILFREDLMISWTILIQGFLFGISLGYQTLFMITKHEDNPNIPEHLTIIPRDNLRKTLVKCSENFVKWIPSYTRPTRKSYDSTTWSSSWKLVKLSENFVELYATFLGFKNKQKISRNNFIENPKGDILVRFIDFAEFCFLSPEFLFIFTVRSG